MYLEHYAFRAKHLVFFYYSFIDFFLQYLCCTLRALQYEVVFFLSLFLVDHTLHVHTFFFFLLVLFKSRVFHFFFSSAFSVPFCFGNLVVDVFPGHGEGKLNEIK